VYLVIFLLFRFKLVFFISKTNKSLETNLVRLLYKFNKINSWFQRKYKHFFSFSHLKNLSKQHSKAILSSFNLQNSACLIMLTAASVCFSISTLHPRSSDLLTHWNECVIVPWAVPWRVRNAWPAGGCSRMGRSEPVREDWLSWLMLTWRVISSE